MFYIHVRDTFLPVFCDVTIAATFEMIRIMQEYNEVVLCLGSSANVKNTEIFLQADCTYVATSRSSGIHTCVCVENLNCKHFV